MWRRNREQVADSKVASRVTGLGGNNLTYCRLRGRRRADWQVLLQYLRDQTNLFYYKVIFEVSEEHHDNRLVSRLIFEPGILRSGSSSANLSNVTFH
jgi:hypothetical protein